MLKVKCTKEESYHFDKEGIKCVAQCPEGFQKKPYKNVNICTKPYKEMSLSSSLGVNRGKRRAAGSTVDIKRGSAIKKFPASVLDTSTDPPTFKKDGDGNFLLNDKACKVAAENMKKVGKAKAYGVFSMMANVQASGSKAKSALVKCRDSAYCVYRKDSFDEFKAKKLREKKSLTDEPARSKIDKEISKKAAAINKKYPDCVKI
jgi:hypothetical protein